MEHAPSFIRSGPLDRSADCCVAKYVVNKRGVAKARALIDIHQYRVRSRWADAQPRAAEQNAFLLDKSRR